MTRTIIFGVFALLLGFIIGDVRDARGHEPHTSSQQITRREKECRFQWMDGATWTPREEWKTANCVVQRWPIDGGLAKLLDVGNCESGMNRFAYNAGGPYVGLFQHALSAWPYRLSSYEPDWWSLRDSWRNSRSAITVTVRMVQAQGWSAWTCA